MTLDTKPAVGAKGFTFTESKLSVADIMELYKSLMVEVKIDLLLEYKATRISGPKYAETMAELQKAAMNSAVQAIVSFQTKETEADRCVKRAQCAKISQEIDASQKTTKANVDLIEAKEKAERIKNGDSADGNSLYGFNKKVLQSQDKLYQRQTIGFDDNARQKYYDSSVSSFSIMFQDLQSDVVPSNMDVNGIQTIGKWVQSGVGRPT